tara:strand:- start:11203 stop:12159 length:957 start_codon:yes stop_codon:yes gene_type:complete
MKLISFDVGIKNMAYCILDHSENGTFIDKWGILNLMEDDNISHKCDCMNIPKSKKASPKECGKKAKYIKNDKYYCEKHAKECSQYMIPTKEMSIPSLKKLKLNDLILQGNKNLVFLNVENIDKLKKAELLNTIIEYYKIHCFEVIITKKRKTAGETDLIYVGKQMKEQLNQIENIDNIEYAIIENQISPIATRMKTVQGMLAQYFIMLNDETKIEFVSSSHKLKQFSELKIDDREHCNEMNEKTSNTTTFNSNYKKHKKDGVYYCSLMINANDNFNKWTDALKTKKKDDLADSFLQGIWYLKHKNIIMYAEDLKINSV